MSLFNMPLGIGRYSQHNKLTLDTLDLDEEVALGIEFDVLFLGKRSLNSPTGDATIQTAMVVDQIYAEKYSPIGSSIHLRRLRIKVSDQFISITQPPTRNKPAELLTVFHFNQITCISTDIKHERAFVIVYKNFGLYDANIFLCDSKKLAKDLLKACADAYQIRVSNNDSLRVRASSIGLEVLHLDHPDDVQKDQAIININKQQNITDDVELINAEVSLETTANNNKTQKLKAAEKNDVSVAIGPLCLENQSQPCQELLFFDKSESTRSMDELPGIGGVRKRLGSNNSSRSLSMTNMSSKEFSEFGEFQSFPFSNQVGDASLQLKAFHSGLPVLWPLPQINFSNRASSLTRVNPIFPAVKAPLFIGPEAAPLYLPITPTESEFGHFQNMFSQQMISAEEDDDEFTSLATKRVVELPNPPQPHGQEALVLMYGQNEQLGDSLVTGKPNIAFSQSLTRKQIPKYVSEDQNLLEF